MDILQQLSELLDELDRKEKAREAEEEQDASLLLVTVLDDYRQAVKSRKWKRAHESLVLAIQLLNDMISQLPAE